MARRKLDLDVSQPKQVPITLDNAAEAYFRSAIQLAEKHQNKQAGRPWDMIARELEKSAERIRVKLRTMGY